MKRLFFTGLAAFCFLLIIAAVKTNHVARLSKSIKKEFAPVAVLELFTSQGCSSCPPADDLLGKYTVRVNENIFPLSFHVDYWNYLGWKDIYSMPAYSERQKKYASVLDLQSIYTPQLVINGNKECVGSNEATVANDVKEILKQPAAVRISGEATIRENSVAVACSVEGDFKNNVLNIALVEIKSSVPVKAGENNGATLNHYNVVRAWKVINTVSEKNNLVVELPKDVSRANTKIILYTQNKETYKITGATQLTW
jgi:hypothetical protein